MSVHFALASQYYDRVFEWVIDALTLHQAENHSPLFIGVNGPQGSGKSTVTSELVKRGVAMGVPMLAISIDDFYLGREDQKELAEQNPNNRFLQQRGYPGTHDVELGRQTLQRLKDQEDEVLIPRYDKSAFDGKGDALPVEQWAKVNGAKLKVVFLEGWMLGFLPLTERGLQMHVKALQLTPNDAESLMTVNQELMQYEAWLEQLDAFIRLKVSDFSWVVEWRAEAEENMKASGKSGMSHDEVISYTTGFLPAYHSYTSSLDLFSRRFENFLELELNKERLPKTF